MKILGKSLSIALAIIVLSFTACSDGGGNSGRVESSITQTGFGSIPQSLATNSDPIAQQAYGYAIQATAISAFSAYLEIPNNATKIEGKRTVWQWSQQGITVQYIVDETATDWLFEVSLDYGSGMEKLFYMRDAKDGSGGHIDYYSGTTIYATYDWVVNGNSTTVEYDILGGFYKYECTLNKDGSGSVKQYFDTDLDFEASWNANGSGSWTTYNTDGTVLDSGSWV